MKKLQAAMRDKAAQGWRERKLYYRIGSVFKACAHCGDYDEEGERYTSGYHVFRAYKPWWMGWTYKCMECGATDLECWANATDIGREPIVGARDAVRERKAELRKAREAAARDDGEKGRYDHPVKEQNELAALMEQLKQLEEKLKRGEK